MNFGASVFDGSTRSLEIGVRSFNASTNVNTNAYAVLSPRQTFTSVPYAIQSINASNAMKLTRRCRQRIWLERFPTRCFRQMLPFSPIT